MGGKVSCQGEGGGCVRGMCRYFMMWTKGKSGMGGKGKGKQLK